MAGPFLLATASPNLKGVRLEDLPEEAWRIAVGSTADVNADSAGGLYKAVSVLYRCAMLRADAIAGMPWGLKRQGETGDDIEQPEQTRGLEWLAGFGGILRELELSQVVHGRSYLLKEQNRFRFVKGLRKLYPPTIEPKFDSDNGLIGFERKLPGKPTPTPYKIEQLVYIWQPNPNSEVGPGPAPAQVALAAAGVLRGIDLFGKAFFERGAILTTVLGVEGNPAPEELRRLERWWKSLLSGVKKAFETVAVRASIKPTVVGAPPKDLALPEVTLAKREDIAVALGVPMSLLFAKAANFATAQTDKLNFYDHTIKPECTFLAEALNAQLFNPLGYEFSFHPEELEVYQELEAQKGFQLVAAAQATLVTREEWRDQMGMPRKAEGEYVQVQANVEHGSVPKERGNVAADNGASVPMPNDSGRPGKKAVEMLEDWVTAELNEKAQVAALPEPFREGVYP